MEGAARPQPFPCGFSVNLFSSGQGISLFLLLSLPTPHAHPWTVGTWDLLPPPLSKGCGSQGLVGERWRGEEGLVPRGSAMGCWCAPWLNCSPRRITARLVEQAGK